MPDVSRSRHMQSGIMIKTIFIPLLDLASCLHSCLFLLCYSLIAQTKLSSVPLQMIKPGHRGFLWAVWIHLHQLVLIHWKSWPTVRSWPSSFDFTLHSLQANHKCPSPVIIYLNFSSQRKRWQG